MSFFLHCVPFSLLYQVLRAQYGLCGLCLSVTGALLSPYCVLVRSRPHYDFFEHVQNSPTSAKTIKIVTRPYRFLLRSFYVVQVRTAPDRFYNDVVGTWSSVAGVLITTAVRAINALTERKHRLI